MNIVDNTSKFNTNFIKNEIQNSIDKSKANKLDIDELQKRLTEIELDID